MAREPNLGCELLLGATEEQAGRPEAQTQVNVLTDTKNAKLRLLFTGNDPSQAQQLQEVIYKQDGLETTRARIDPEIINVDIGKHLTIQVLSITKQPLQTAEIPREVVGNLLGTGVNLPILHGAPCIILVSQPDTDEVHEFRIEEDQLLSVSKTALKFHCNKGKKSERELKHLL